MNKIGQWSGNVECLAPRLTWDEIKNLAFFLVANHYNRPIDPDRVKHCNDTLVRMGYKSGLSEDTYYDMAHDLTNE